MLSLLIKGLKCGIISKLDVTAAIWHHHHSVGICLQYMVEKLTLWCFLSNDAYFKEEIDFFFFFYQWFSVVDYLASYFTTAILKYSFSKHFQNCYHLYFDWSISAATGLIFINFYFVYISSLIRSKGTFMP